MGLIAPSTCSLRDVPIQQTSTWGYYPVLPPRYRFAICSPQQNYWSARNKGINLHKGTLPHCPLSCTTILHWSRRWMTETVTILELLMVCELKQRHRLQFGRNSVVSIGSQSNKRQLEGIILFFHITTYWNCHTAAEESHQRLLLLLVVLEGQRRRILALLISLVSYFVASLMFSVLLK